MANEAPDELRLVCDDIVADYLQRHGYEAALTAFAQARPDARRTTTAYRDVSRDLRTLVEHAASSATAQALASLRLDDQEDALDLPNEVPRNYTLAATFEHLHSGNILSVTPVAYPGVADACVATSSADKRVVIFRVPTGEVVAMLDKSTSEARAPGHDAAVLDVSQPGDHPYVLTAGMDGKVIVWDLRTDTAVHTLHDHRRFVVCVAHSSDAQYFASAGYDKVIHIYKVDWNGAPKYELVHSIAVRTNPECLLFVRGPADPAQADPMMPKHERWWLVYTCRDNVELHYVAMPGSTEASGVPPWTVLRYNTNPDPDDFHASFSLTGDHGGSDHMNSTASSMSMSRLLLFPLFSPHRRATLWTEAPSSAFSNPRHAWTPDGSAVWVTGEDGILRLVSLQGDVLARTKCHGEFSTPTGNAHVDHAVAAAAWRSSGNTVIKGVVTLPNGHVVSCGFDRTVRVLASQSAP